MPVCYLRWWLKVFAWWQKNCNKNMWTILILRTVFLLKISGIKWNKSHQLSIIVPFNTYLKLFIYSPVTQEEFVKVVHGLAADDASWYSMNEIGNGIPILPLILGTSEENTHYIVVSIGVARVSKNVSFRFLNDKMA